MTTNPIPNATESKAQEDKLLECDSDTKPLANSSETSDAEPVFSVWMDDEKVADLCDPVWRDMYWWDYRVQPTSPEFETVLRDAKQWNRVSFQVLDAEGNCPNPNTFSGNCEEYCAGKTDRLSFRSLPPPAKRNNWYRNFWIVFCIILFIWFLYFI